MNKLLSQLLLILGVVFFIALSLVVIGVNEARQARFPNI